MFACVRQLCAGEKSGLRPKAFFMSVIASLYLPEKTETNIPVKTLGNGTGRSGQTVQTLIRLLLKEQADQGLHYLPFHRSMLFRRIIAL